MSNTKFVLLMMVLALPSCTTYNPPPYEISPPTAWKGSEDKTGESVPEKKSLDNWWTVFDDTDLNELERLAVVQNPTLQSAFFHIKESKAQLTIAESYLYPDVTLAAAAQRRRLPKDPIAAFQQITPQNIVIPGGETLNPVTLLMPKSIVDRNKNGLVRNAPSTKKQSVKQNTSRSQKVRANSRKNSNNKNRGHARKPSKPVIPPCIPPCKSSSSSSTTTAPATVTTATQNQYITFLQILPQVSYELDIWRKFSQAARAQESDVKANEEAYKVALLSLTYEVAQQYFNLRALDSEMDVIKRNIQARKAYLDLNAARYLSGITAKIDYLRADAELEQLQADYEDRKGARAIAENAIAALLGMPASTFKIEVKPFKPKYLDIPIGVPSELLKNRPDIRQSECAIESERLRVGVAKANMYPALLITGFVGYEAPKSSTLFKWRNHVWSIAGQLFANIFDAGNLRAQVEAEKEKYFQAVSSYIDVTTIAFREVEDALSQAAVLQKQQSLKRLELNNYNEVLHLVESQYESGIIDYLQVIDAEQVSLQTERTVVLSDRDRLLSSLQLIKALGGTW